MYVTKYFFIGNVTIVSSWIALILSFIVAYAVVRVRYGKLSATLLGDLLFYFIIVWKLSVVITDLKTVLQFPLSIIYFNGGTIGVFLGLAAGVVRVYIEMKTNKLTNENFMSLLVGIMFIQSMYQIFIALFNEGPSIIRFITIISFSAFMLIVLLFINQFKEMPIQLISLMIAIHLFISALQPAGIMQTPTIFAVVVGGMMLIFTLMKDKYNLEALK